MDGTLEGNHRWSDQMMENRMNAYPTTIDIPREETASLLAKVLAITSFGFLVTAFGVATSPPWGTLPDLLAVLGLIFCDQLRPSSSKSPLRSPSHGDAEGGWDSIPGVRTSKESRQLQALAHVGK
jgi:hypothetical protein